MALELHEYIPGQIWLYTYPVTLPIVAFTARMTIVRLADGRLLLHSPSAIDAELRQALLALGEVAFIVAPGTFHHLHVPSAQAAFPDARTFICPGVEARHKGLHFDTMLSDAPPPEWADEFEQVLMRGSRWMWEVAMFHRSSRTLILVDLIELFTDATPDTGWQLRFWWTFVMRMWNRAKPAPEYQLGWSDKAAARTCLQRILAWDFERIVISHGDLIETDAHAVASKAWEGLLRG